MRRKLPILQLNEVSCVLKWRSYDFSTFLQAFGKTPLTNISPKKTWEGTIMGLGGCIATSVILLKILCWPSSMIRYVILKLQLPTLWLLFFIFVCLWPRWHWHDLVLCISCLWAPHAFFLIFTTQYLEKCWFLIRNQIVSLLNLYDKKHNNDDKISLQY